MIGLVAVGLSVRSARRWPRWHSMPCGRSCCCCGARHARRRGAGRRRPSARAPGWPPSAATSRGSRRSPRLAPRAETGRARRRCGPAPALLLALAASRRPSWPIVRPADGRLRRHDARRGSGRRDRRRDARRPGAARRRGIRRADASRRRRAGGRAVPLEPRHSAPGRGGRHARRQRPRGRQPAIRRLFSIGEEWTAADRGSRAGSAPGIVHLPLDRGARRTAATTRRSSCASRWGSPRSCSRPTSARARERELVASGARARVDRPEGRPPRLALFHHRRVPPRRRPDDRGDLGGRAQLLRPPRPGVLARLASAGATIYRTDRDGALIFETDGGASR